MMLESIRAQQYDDTHPCLNRGIDVGEEAKIEVTRTLAIKSEAINTLRRVCLDKIA
jgi:hypothetical protein